MNVADIIAAFKARGVSLSTVGDRLRFEAPEGVLTDADRERLRTHKADIIAALAGRPTDDDPQRWFDDPTWTTKAEYFAARDTLAAWLANPRIKAALNALTELRLPDGRIIARNPVDHAGADFNRARALAKPGGREFVARHPHGVRPAGAVWSWVVDLYLFDPTTDAGRQRKEQVTIAAVTALRSALDDAGAEQRGAA